LSMEKKYLGSTYDISYTVSNGVVTFTPGTNSYYKHIAYTTITLPENYIIEAYTYDNRPAGGVVYIFQDQDNWLSWEDCEACGYSIPRGYSNGSDVGWLAKLTPQVIPPKIWTFVKTVVKGESVIHCSNARGCVSFVSSYGFSHNGIGFVEHRNYGPLSVDWVRVRKYADIEPIVQMS